MDLLRIYSIAREVYFMERKRNQIELSGFITEEINLPVRPRRVYAGSRIYSRRGHRGKQRNKRKGQVQPFDATSMLIKCGVCAAACALVLLFKWAGSPATAGALQTVKEAVNEESELDEMLGKLKFVALPGILEVFSRSGKLDLPICATESRSLQDNTLLALTSAQQQNVNACLAGSIKETGLDKELGNYVRISSADDRDLYLYGLSTVTVEAGQPMMENDHIGSIEAGGTLFIRILVNGKPEDPLGYFMVQQGNV